MGHWRSRTWSNGTRLSGGRLVRQYWCQRLTGERHTFYVEVGENPRPVTPQPRRLDRGPAGDR